MRASLSVTNYSWTDGLVRHLEAVARAADEAGVDTVWVNDHLIQADPTAGDATEMLEAYTTLGYLAAASSRVRLGTMVSAVTYRPPALLVKSATTLDVLSGGRAWLGLGAGYLAEEAEAMGMPLPPSRERFAQLEDTVRLALQMWSGDVSPFEGATIRLAQPHTSPRPVSQPHPPILIGGMGERHTLRLVAEYGDACNLFDIPDGGETIRRKLAVLAEHCERVGRPPEEIEKTVSTRLSGGESADAFAERCASLAALGIEHAVVITDGPWTGDRLETLAAAVPELESL